ncbi:MULTISPECIES: hypothetical protein [unclassified Streptomyces]|uniref:hypothetical protein n=1 Tax=unclassified Streptomyces TaxID=2593676 RepID=UPI00278BEBD5|nr:MULTISPECIES: hypothetical protein [unclassified Streptomyces]
MTPTRLLPLAAGARATSPVLLGFFVVGGLIAIGAGLSWALDVRSSAPVGYLRLLGAALTLAGVVLLGVTCMLWYLG